MLLMQVLSQKNLEVLELLERFKYLSISHFIKLGIASSQPSVSRIMKRFESKKPFVTKITFPINVKTGRVPDIYCLSKYGAEYLASYKEVSIDEINYIKTITPFKDYNHRMKQVEFYIDLYLRSLDEEFTIDFFYNYFDKSGGNNSKEKQSLEPKTKIYYEDGNYYIPDGIYKLSKTLEDGSIQSCLYSLEIHCGNDTKRALETIEKNVQALIDGSISDKFEYSYGNKVVMVFDDERSKELVLNRLNEIDGFEEFREYFKWK
jgi:hypothetical protein